jgi:lipooligosaccharide transport system permease protein
VATPAPVRYVEFKATQFRHIWRGTVTTTVVGPVLYLLAMGVGLGSLVDEAGHEPLAGVSYLSFVAPALLAAAAMQAGYGESTFPVLSSVKWNPTAVGQVATPLRPADLAIGHLVWTAVRLTLVSVAFTAVMFVFAVPRSVWVLAAPPAAVLCGLAVAAPTAAWSISRQDDSSFPNLMRFGIMPMFLLSGTFFPVSQLPDWMEWLAWVTPLYHGVVLTRGFTLGTIGIWSALGHAAFLAAMVAVGGALSVRNHHRRLAS